jgi:signal transduction histidine kinase
MTQYRTTLFYNLSYLIIAAVAVRGLGFYYFLPHPRFWLVASLLITFTLLLATERGFTRRFSWYPHLYMALQSGLIISLSLFRPPLDFFNALYLPLSGQAMLLFRQRTAYLWVTIFSVVMAGSLVYGLGWFDSLGLIILYTAGYFFVVSYGAITIQADAARRESLTLLAELQAAHRQLQDSAAQAEELAITQERNRLARDLHDSVTQALFSMTLTIRAIRLMLPQDPKQAATQLDRLQALTESALAEMRTLIAQLRPSAVETQGFIPALRQHLVMRQSQDNLSIDLKVTGQQPLSPQQARNLFGIVQEALNNVVKHAHTDWASVTVALTEEAIHLLVQDEGSGFDLAKTFSNETGIGLASMRERAEVLGGKLTVVTSPGAGTKIQVDAPLAGGEQEHE